jgi:hypothetical protein
LDVTRAEYEALDWLTGDRSEPSPYRTHSFSLIPAAGGETSGDWTLNPGRSGPAGTIYTVDRAPVADVLDVNLLGLAVSIIPNDGSGIPLATTAAWQDGAPAHTPAIAWRPIADGWPTCRLDGDGMLVMEGSVTVNPMDYY